VELMKAKPNPISLETQSKAFTLVELLVVIVIIIVLVSIGFPLAKNIQANASRAQCINQLRTWGVAMGGYAADHDGKVNWEHWPSIGSDPLVYSPYISYWTGASDDRTGFEMQLNQRNCPVVKYNKKTSNSPVTYSTIQPVGVAKVGVGGRGRGESSDYPLSKIKKYCPVYVHDRYHGAWCEEWIQHIHSGRFHRPGEAPHGEGCGFPP
jgi:prepilin-type N-terminal cleavage/methylation domain-containing protein